MRHAGVAARVRNKTCYPPGNGLRWTDPEVISFTILFCYIYKREIYIGYYDRITKGETEMDELKFKLSTKFMRGIIASILSKVISKKFGYDVDIQINEIALNTVDGKVKIHVDVDGEVSNDEFKNIIKSVVKD